jgi:hypothetical protein
VGFSAGEGRTAHLLLVRLNAKSSFFIDDPCCPDVLS